MSKSKAKLEYIWLDGYKPTQSLRSKTKIVSDFSGKLEDCEVWCFDGSSTEQAPGGSSDCLLKPVFICVDPQRTNGYLVMCEVIRQAHSSFDVRLRVLLPQEVFGRDRLMAGEHRVAMLCWMSGAR